MENKLDQIVTEQPANLNPVNLNYLFPYAPAPCAMFVYFKTKFLLCVPAHETVGLELYYKFKTEFNGLGFIRKSEQKKWEEWRNQRHPQNQPILQIDPDKKPLTAKIGTPSVKKNKQEFWYYATSKITFNGKTDVEEEAIKKSEKIMRDAVDGPLMDWYFSGHDFVGEPVVHHCSRVTYLALLFATTTLHSLPPNTLLAELLAFSCMIHELEGDPRKTKDHGAHSTRTIEILQSKGNPVPKEVIDIISQQDEFFDGTGLPKHLKGKEISVYARVFSLINVFDHLRLTHSGGTRRIRFERTKRLMVKRINQFDPVLWPLFWTFMENVEILE